MIILQGRHNVVAQEAVRQDENGWEETVIGIMASDRSSVSMQIVNGLENFSKLESRLGRKNKKLIDGDKTCRVSLSQVWKAVREHFKAQLEQHGTSEKDIEEEMSAISADTTSEHIAYVAMKYEAIETKIESDNQAKLEKAKKVVAEIQTTWGVEIWKYLRMFTRKRRRRNEQVVLYKQTMKHQK